MTEWIQYDVSTGIISINTGAKADDTTRVQRLDSSGSICEKFLLEQTGSTQIDTSHWTNGTWFIRVEKKQEVQLKRILITK
ncbi:MAG: T9SS type A sorting domain-containing protein [Bacteroidota bacterium]